MRIRTLYFPVNITIGIHISYKLAKKTVSRIWSPIKI
jgi:hypothetical protein